MLMQLVASTTSGSGVSRSGCRLSGISLAGSQRCSESRAGESNDGEVAARGESHAGNLWCGEPYACEPIYGCSIDARDRD